MPSVSSRSRPKVFDSSTVMTPSLPTLSIASAMISPTVVSAAEIDAVEAICSLVSTSLAMASSCSDTAETAASMPRFRPIGLAPAATLRRPSRTMAWARTVAVVGDRGGAPLLLQDDVAALGAEGDLDRVGEGVHTPLEPAAGLLVESNQLGHIACDSYRRESVGRP